METTNIKQIEEYLSSLSDKSKHTYRSYSYAIRLFCEKMNIQSWEDIENITSASIERYKNILKKGLSPSTVNTRLRPVEAMFGWFIKPMKYLKENPFVGVEYLSPSKKVQTVLTDEEKLKIFDGAKTAEDKLILSLLLTTGLRREELVNIKLFDIIDNRYIKIIGKGNKEALIVLHDDVLRFLPNYLRIRNMSNKAKNNVYLFPSSHGGHYTGATIYNRIKKIMAQAGFDDSRIEDIHPHSFRHTFTTDLFDANANAEIIRQAVRHSSITTTMGYAHLSRKALDNTLLNQKSIFAKSLDTTRSV